MAQASTLVVGLYTGYFGAASGVLFLALVGLVSVASLHELNAAKNLLVGIANAVATVIFVLAAPVRWPMALALAAGSILGGGIGPGSSVASLRRTSARGSRWWGWWWRCDVRERAEALIEIAHPDFRDQLRAGAALRNLL